VHVRWLVGVCLVLAACLAVSVLRIAAPSASPVAHRPLLPIARPARSVSRPAVPKGAPSYRAAAHRTYRALNRNFPAGHGLLYKYAGGGKYAGVWAAAQAIDGTVELARLPGGGVGRSHIRAMFESLRFYWDRSGGLPGYDKDVRAPFGGGGYRFYDDNVLVGLALIRAYELTHDQVMLARAEQVFAFEVGGWDRNAADPFPGGVFWTQSPKSHNRNTVSTAGAAQLGLHLYLLTGKQRYLQWAMKMYSWVNSTLRAPDGLYWDRVNRNGRIHPAIWSYNQGLMLGTDALLYRATGDRSYLDRATSLADTAVAFYRHGNRLVKQRPIFNGIFFENLIALDRLAPNPAYRRAAKGYVRYLGRYVDRSSGLLWVSHQPMLLDQAALLQLNASIASKDRRVPTG
jgi:Glycosyl hydrolase family 76